jgi:hypothetical protein
MGKINYINNKGFQEFCMEIMPVNNNLYDRRGEYHKYSKGGHRPQKNHPVARPVDAIVFDLGENQEKRPSQEVKMLEAYINALPDEEVNRRIRDFKNSFSDLASALAVKLITEAL